MRTFKLWWVQCLKLAVRRVPGSPNSNDSLGHLNQGMMQAPNMIKLQVSWWSVIELYGYIFRFHFYWKTMHICRSFGSSPRQHSILVWWGQGPAAYRDGWLPRPLTFPLWRWHEWLPAWRKKVAAGRWLQMLKHIKQIQKNMYII